jgi:hypothetical protein
LAPAAFLGLGAAFFAGLTAATFLGFAVAFFFRASLSLYEALTLTSLPEAVNFFRHWLSVFSQWASLMP